MEQDISTRLARENYWTKKFTESAILEYKKFMYLAGTSEFMVSPSEIVDAVWHQHLIFTQSYTDFCNIIGKQIQHVPSTHNKEEFDKFRQAKERTRRLYEANFGEELKEIWEYATMYDSLDLPKAKLKIRTFILLGVFAFVMLLIPFYFLLKPIYIHINNPDFILGFISVAALTFILLEAYNKTYLGAVVKQFHEHSFIYHLRPFELVYLKTQKLANVIHGTINQLVEDKILHVNHDFTVENTRNLKASTIEEHHVLNTLHALGTVHYPLLLKHLMQKPVFRNVANCMDAFKKYFIKSKVFGKLFYINFVVLALLITLGLVRYSTGLLRDRPVAQIFMVVAILTVLAIAYLCRLIGFVCVDTIPKLYQKEILPKKEIENSWQWQYFLMGSTVLTSSFVPLVNYTNKNENNSTGTCGSSGGSSCGSSCSSCGGCGGD
jgi:uncharacterized membrane protein YgcG